MIRNITPQRRRPSIKTGLYLGGAILCTSAMAYVGFAAYGKPVPDPQGCYNGLPRRENVILIDASTPRWTDEQQRALQAALPDQFAGLGFNDRLSIITTEGDVVSDLPVPRLSICGLARTPADLEAIDAAPVTQAFLDRTHDQRYREQIAPELEQILALVPDTAREQSTQSPLLEQIQAVSHSGRITAGSRLTVISDLIQNSDSARFCTVKGHLPPFDRFKHSAAYARTKPAPMPGAQVDILMLQRPGLGQGDYAYCTEDELAQFWQLYFEDLGASVQLTRLRDGSVGG